MKKILCICCYLSLTLSIILPPHIANAQPQGIGQGQSSGVTNLSPSRSQDTAAQIQGLMSAIKDVQQAIDDAMKELHQMIDDLNQLRAERPAPPTGNSPQERDAYTKRRIAWQDKITAKEHQVVAQQAKINQLQKELSDLQQQLANMQKAPGDSSGKKTPLKVMPRK